MQAEPVSRFPVNKKVCRLYGVRTRSSSMEANNDARRRKSDVAFQALATALGVPISVLREAVFIGCLNPNRAAA